MGGDQRQDSNVLIPDTGAGPYWYVDPRAHQQQQMAQGPTMQVEQAMQAGRPSINIMQAVQRMINPDPNQQVAASAAISRMNGQPYDPMADERSNQAQLKAWNEQSHQMGPEDVYKTVGIEIRGKEMEVPAVYDNMTDEERNIIQYLPHTQWPKHIMDKIENNARDNLEQGNDPFGNPLQPKIGF